VSISFYFNVVLIKLLVCLTSLFSFEIAIPEVYKRQNQQYIYGYQGKLHDQSLKFEIFDFTKHSQKLIASRTTIQEWFQEPMVAPKR